MGPSAGLALAAVRGAVLPKRALPSSSVSYSVVWVSRFPEGKYGIWYRFRE